MKIGTVIVTYNRIGLLKQVLKKFESMIRGPDCIIIVNNASTDGTTEFLNEWSVKTSLKNVEIDNVKSNLGGSGGFYKGLERAVKRDVDWIWVSDDDAFPDTDVFEKFEMLEHKLSLNNVGAYCTTVINNGEIDYAHRRKLSGALIKNETQSCQADYSREYFKINLFSYVGTILNKDALLDVGLTEKDYFIWYDDTEHSMRLDKKYNIYCLPDLKVVHDVPQNDTIVSWKMFYGVRNKLLMYKKHYKATYILQLLNVASRNFLGLILFKNIKIRKLHLKALIACIRNTQGIDESFKPGEKI